MTDSRGIVNFCESNCTCAAGDVSLNQSALVPNRPYFTFFFFFFLVLGDCSTMDLALLVDRSKSMQTYQRNLLVKIIYRLVDKIGVSKEGNHFAVGTFGPSSAIYNNLKAPEAQNAMALKNQIRQRISHIPKD